MRDIGPELRPNDYKKKDESVDRLSGIDDKDKDKEPTTLEDLGNQRCPFSFGIKLILC